MRYRTILGCVWLLAVASGCQHQDLAERRARMRRDSIARTVSTIVRGEATRPARIERTIAAIDRRARRDARNTALGGERIGDYIERNFRRWRERQRDYREGINRHFLRRRPENIEPTAIILFR